MRTVSLPPDSAPLPPPDLPVRLSSDALVHTSGQLVAGGAPFRIIRLTPAGRKLLHRWTAGDRVGEGEAARQLARRLLDNGLLYPDPQPRASLANVSAVVPVRNTAEQLDRCLASLRKADPGLEIIVVDDGSDNAPTIADIASRYGARLLCHEQPKNAGTARNTGLASGTRPLVAFVDADVIIESGSLHRLAAQFDDPAVAAAAPRVCPLTEAGLIGGYEARHSSLDMGAAPAPVAPGTWVPYVPSATMVIRRSALDEVGGFDEALRLGEDVDLVWRLVAAGHRVIYDPSARILHDHRRDPKAFLARRWQYAYSIGPLARRHPTALYAFKTDLVVAAALSCAVCRRPRLALAACLVRVVLLLRALGAPSRLSLWLTREIGQRMFSGTLRGAAHAVLRTWSPFLLLHRGTRRLLVVGFLIRLFEHDGPRNPADVMLNIAEDLVAAFATLASSARNLTVRPILVDFSPTRSLWPNRERLNSITTDEDLTPPTSRGLDTREP